MADWDLLKRDRELGAELLESSLISAEDLAAAEELAAGEGRELSDVLVEHGFVDSDVLGPVLTEKYGVRVVDLTRVEIQPTAVALLPEKAARETQALPVSLDGDTLTVAMRNPQDYRAVQKIAGLTRKKIEAVKPLGADLAKAIDRHYSLRDQIEEQIGQVRILNGGPEAGRLAGLADLRQSPVTQAVEMVLNQAVRDRASDIHVEAQEDCIVIRNRIDGVLQESVRLPLGVHSAIMTRIKVLANLNIAERRRPQDGQFSAEVGGKKVDFRVATVEGTYGERATLRVLDKSMLLIKLSELGMSPSVLKSFERLLAAPFGMILVNGPTGSGKTTTLYGALQQLDAEHRNIMTIEDPVEYAFKGITQIQVNRQAGITFPVGLRAIMRHDPDIILVGEIRDAETAVTAVQAAITGHLVLSSIHANDAVSALIRLVDMGVEPFLVSTAVIGSLSQRLVRRVCTYCRDHVEVSVGEAAAYEAEMGESRTKFAVGRGCNFCSRSGYLGRIGAFELLTVNDEIRSMVVRRAAANEMKQEAISTGMVPMQTDGMLKVRDGVTTPKEVLRNVFTIV